MNYMPNSSNCDFKILESLELLLKSKLNSVPDPWHREEKIKKKSFTLKDGIEFPVGPGIYWLASKKRAAKNNRHPVYYIGKANNSLHCRLKDKMKSDYNTSKKKNGKLWPSLRFYRDDETEVYYLPTKQLGKPADLELIMLAAFYAKNKMNYPKNEDKWFPEGNTARRKAAEDLSEKEGYEEKLKQIGDKIFQKEM